MKNFKFNLDMKKVIGNIICLVGSILLGVLSELIVGRKQFNEYRAILFVCVIYILVFTFYNQSLIIKKIENMFLVACLVMGTCMIILLPYNSYVSWDDETHFSRAYELSFYGSEVVWTKTVDEFVNRKVEIALTKTDRQQLVDYLNENHDYSNPVKVTKSTYMYEIGSLVYQPQAFGLWITRSIGFSYDIQYIFGKFMNLLVYSFAFFFAIKYAKLGKRFIVVLGLLPTSMLTATTYSYDAVFISFFMLAISLIIGEFIERDKKLTAAKAAIICAIMVCGCMPKAVYIPMILLLLFLPKEKFYNKIQRRLFNVGIVAIFIVMMSSFLFIIMSGVVTNNVMDADIRGGGTSIVGQIYYIINNPLSFTKLFIKTIANEIFTMNFGKQALVWFCHLGEYANYAYFTLLSLLLFIGITDVDSETESIKIGKKLKFILVAIYTIILVELYMTIYLTYIEVGGQTFAGVQGRYFVPLLYPLFLILRTNKIKSSFNIKWMNMIPILVCTILLGYGIYKLIYVPFY